MTRIARTSFAVHPQSDANREENPVSVKKGDPMRSGFAVVCLVMSTIAAADITDPEILERTPVPYPMEAKKLALEGDVDLTCRPIFGPTDS